MDLLIGLAYMPYDSCDLPPQDNVRILIAHAEYSNFSWAMTLTPTMSVGGAQLNIKRREPA